MRSVAPGLLEARRVPYLAEVQENGSSNCDHPRRAGCVYCPTCGVRYPLQLEARSESGGCLAWLMAPADMVSRIWAGTESSPDLDVAANIEQIRTGDPDKIRRALGFLRQLGPFAWRARPLLEDLQNHEDLDIAHRARDILGTLD